MRNALKTSAWSLYAGIVFLVVALLPPRLRRHNSQAMAEMTAAVSNAARSLRREWDD